MSLPNTPTPRFGVFLEDSGNVAGTIDLQDKLRIGEFNTDQVREMSVEDFLKRGSPGFSSLSPAQRLKKLEELFAKGSIVQGARPRLAPEVRKAAADAETDRRLAVERERLGGDFQALHRDWESYYSDLEKAGRETPELKLREARLEARTAELHRRSETLGLREKQEALVYGLEELLGADLDSRSLRIQQLSPNTLRVAAGDATRKGLVYFVDVHAPAGGSCTTLRTPVPGPEGEPRHGRAMCLEPETFAAFRAVKDGAR
ncbi:hypothetical protein FBR05_05355 [Deltaproteobacteria bacterium PRO3]|nr:hypothetical protein [Deltaproteobacteria bacterium PRO3]